MGFGDGKKYISFGTDFDGRIGNLAGLHGLHIYPPCSSGARKLAKGNIRNVLKGSSKYDKGAHIALRKALAGGDLNNWETFGGTEVHNGNTWPGML